MYIKPVSSFPARPGKVCNLNIEKRKIGNVNIPCAPPLASAAKPQPHCFIQGEIAFEPWSGLGTFKLGTLIPRSVQCTVYSVQLQRGNFLKTNARYPHSRVLIYKRRCALSQCSARCQVPEWHKPAQKTTELRGACAMNSPCPVLVMAGEA